MARVHTRCVEDALIDSYFVGKFEERYIPEPNSGCWLWIGGANQYGYGRFYIRGRLVLAHRFAYQAFRAPLTLGLELDHLCRNRGCVNPDHLEEVTHTTNVRRGGARLDTHCKSGHAWTEENTWRGKQTGWRQCRQCNRDNQKRMYDRRKAQS